ncbi:MAG TPA: Maf family protein [Pyrinomonadaceae bacterium]|nr:Maf family protein [Pyrinomonadaceae bacterium]
MLVPRLILASKSPRRAEILRAAGWTFETLAANIDETRQANETAVDYVQRLAQEKAEAVAKKLQSGLILGADTIVVVNDEILGQPRDKEDARRMLGLLSGKWHEVFTGVALLNAGNERRQLAHQVTRVRFAEISPAEIEWYISTGEPSDKAGAYAIQGRGSIFIEEVQGDYFNIVGLPIRLVYRLLVQIYAEGNDAINWITPNQRGQAHRPD